MSYSSPVSVSHAQELARRQWPRLIFDFIDGAAGEGLGLARAMRSIQELSLQPRSLVDVQHRDLTTNLLGRDYAVPFGIAPMGMCNLAWPGADVHLSSLARDEDLPLGISTAASTPMERMMEIAGERCWFQLYPGSNQELQADLLDRAEQSGCDVLLLTVDVPQLAPRPREKRSGFKVPFRLTPRLFTDFALHPYWSLATLFHGVPYTANIDRNRFGAFQRDEGRDRATWETLDELRRRWKGKLVIKGITSDSAALKARDAGADAVYVSGHGGRQLESLPPPIYQLAAIRDAVGEDFPLIYDTGIRGGEDIVTALAVGASFVCLGRPFLYGLGCGGRRGLRAIFHILTEEVSSTMAQLGICHVSELSRDVLSLWQPPGCPANLVRNVN